MHVRAPAPALLSTLLLCGCGGAAATPAPRAALVAPAARASEPPRAAEPPPAEPPPRLRLPCEDDDLVGCTNGCADHQTEDCVTLGVMYLGGAIVSIDVERAVSLFRTACTEGSARGCLKLADAYHERLATGGADEEAALYRRACDAGANVGCLAAGRAYLQGEGVSSDPALAATLFRRVCERGNAPACIELARLHTKGDGVPRDPQKAVELFTKACKLGADEGCLMASRTGDVLPPRD